MLRKCCFSLVSVWGALDLQEGGISITALVQLPVIAGLGSHVPWWEESIIHTKPG